MPVSMWGVAKEATFGVKMLKVCILGMGFYEEERNDREDSIGV